MLEAIRKKIAEKDVRLSHIISDRVLTIAPEVPVKVVAHLLFRYRISGIPVVDKDKTLLGMVTIDDLYRLMNEILDGCCDEEKYLQEEAITAADIMNTEVLSIGPNTKIERVVELMCRRNVHTIPVVRKKKVVGIVGGRDILNIVF